MGRKVNARTGGLRIMGEKIAPLERIRDVVFSEHIQVSFRARI